jgi:hypothetical protein
MLQKERVSESLLTLLKELQEAAVFKDYFLVGGTKLARSKNGKTYIIIS